MPLHLQLASIYLAYANKKELAITKNELSRIKNWLEPQERINKSNISNILNEQPLDNILLIAASSRWQFDP